jgi:hypothetical protein
LKEFNTSVAATVTEFRNRAGINYKGSVVHVYRSPCSKFWVVGHTKLCVAAATAAAISLVKRIKERICADK